MLRLILLVYLSVFVVFSISGHATAQDAASQTEMRSETGGATTLEDILRRQRGEDVDLQFRKNATGDPEAAASTTDPLGTLGGASDPELWRALRYGSADVTSQVRSPAATLLVQDGGMAWLQFREGPLRIWGGYFLLGVVGLLVLFYLLRGRIKIGAGRSGQTILRFTFIERFAHWLLAGSFILLGITGLITLFGRKGFIPFIGHEAYATLALASKWVHNNVSWAFMLALILVFLFWVIHNLPSRHDLVWFAKGGGILTKAHPPAKKFNAGQKIIFWSVILLGASISASGLALLFPFELPMFEATFDKMRAIGVSSLPIYGPLPESMTPHGEMQHAQIWHAVVSFILMGIIIAHIYIGSVGMEGAYDAMGSGEVDLNWAREHHSLWVEDVEAKSHSDMKSGDATPAE